MIFNDIFPSYTVFKLAIDTAIDIYRDDNQVLKAEWLDETIIFSSFKTIFFHLNNFYKNRQIRYSTEIWMGLFLNRFVDSCFDLFFKQQAFYNKELKIIRDYKLRDGGNVVNSSGDNVTNRSETSATLGGLNTPLNEDDNVATREQTKGNMNSDNVSVNYNVVQNLKMLLEFKYKIGIDEFIESFNMLFRQYIGARINYNNLY